MVPQKRRASQMNAGRVKRPKLSKRTTEPPEVEEQTKSNFVAALYWDINSVCHFQSIIADDPAEEDKIIFDTMCHDTQSFIDKILFHYIHSPANSARLIGFIEELGWKLFAICAQAVSFRQMCIQATLEEWPSFQEQVQTNQRSLEVFARARRLEWRGTLLKYAQKELPGLKEALMPEIDIAKEHPHHLVQTLDGHLRRPRYKGKAQVHINKHIFNRSKFYSRRHPMLRQKKWGPCNLCGSAEPCDCRINSMAGDLIELVEYKDKGTGVRALAEFKAGDILGEYTGVIEELGRSTDTVYLLRQGVHYRNDKGRLLEDNLANINPAHFGAWVRYINHSCDASTFFAYRVVGRVVTTIVVAVRDISIFEELTVDYGDSYWSSKGWCLCGSSRCRFPAALKS